MGLVTDRMAPGTMSAGWNVFIATLDRAALPAERPWSDGDVAMRSKHAAKVSRFWHPVSPDALEQVVAEASKFNRAAGRRRAAAKYAAPAARKVA